MSNLKNNLAQPFIKLFKTLGKFYAYDVNTNHILDIKKITYIFLSNYKLDWNLEKARQNLEQQYTQKEINECFEELNNLLLNGFLKSNRIKKIEHSESKLLEYKLKNSIRMLILQVTQNCNFRCEYCAYSDNYQNRKHGNARMSFETAKKGIDFLINNSSENEEIYLSFYGGEPLLEFKLIKKCVKYAKDTSIGKRISFVMTTNATLIDQEKLIFLKKNEFDLLISLDGPKEIHDKNRRFAVNNCGTFDKVMEKITFIWREDPEYARKIRFNIVLDPDNQFGCLNEFVTSYEYVRDMQINVSSKSETYLSKEEGPINQNEKKVQYYNDLNCEIFKYYLYKLQEFDFQSISKIVYANEESNFRNIVSRMISNSVPDVIHPGGPCIPGVTRLFLNAKGFFYPCERVSEVSEIVKIGNIESGIDLNKARDLLNVGKVTEDECKNCWAYRFCTLCVAYADDLESISSKQRLKYCSICKKRVAESMKNYCVLKEHHADLENLVFV